MESALSLLVLGFSLLMVFYLVGVSLNMLILAYQDLNYDIEDVGLGVFKIFYSWFYLSELRKRTQEVDKRDKKDVLAIVMLVLAGIALASLMLYYDIDPLNYVFEILASIVAMSVTIFLLMGICLFIKEKRRKHEN